MDQDVTSREQVRDVIINLIANARLEQGLDPIHLDDRSPVFSKGMERGTQKAEDMVLNLESAFGLNLADNPSQYGILSTIGSLADYIYTQMGAKYD